MQASYAADVASEVSNDYEGAQVWRTDFNKPSDTDTIKKLSDNQVISMWSLRPQRADYLVKHEDKLDVHRLLKANHMNHSVLVLDVKRRMALQKIKPIFWDDKTLRVGHRLNLEQFPTLEIIDEYFEYLTENFPSICKINIIGRTAENRTIKMAKISNGNPENKVIMITAGMHAREWIAVTSALYMLDGLVAKFDQLPVYIRNKDWIIVPLVNPDGFHYTQSHDRFWRKNRKQLSKCVGVDVNRNFEVDWDFGSLRVMDECHGAYSGQRPFSEAESVAIRDLLLQQKNKPNGLIDLHSYGKLIMYPWGARSEQLEDNNLHRNTAIKMIRAIYNATRQKYTSGPTYSTIYPTTGAGVDWAYQAGVNLTFAIEAGGDNYGGFLSPPSSIKTIGKEVLAAVKVLAKVIDPQVSKRTGAGVDWF